MIELYEYEPGKWRIYRAELKPARSDLPLPYVISDHMEPTEQIDGKFYTSKRAFRAVGRAAGLTEVGNEKITPKRPQVPKTERVKSIRKAIERYKSGERTNAVKIT